MKHIGFECDGKKAKANAKNHGVSFEEARTAFYDERAVFFHGPDTRKTTIVLFCLAQAAS